MSDGVFLINVVNLSTQVLDRVFCCVRHFLSREVLQVPLYPHSSANHLPQCQISEHEILEMHLFLAMLFVLASAHLTVTLATATMLCKASVCCSMKIIATVSIIPPITRIRMPLRIALVAKAIISTPRPVFMIAAGMVTAMLVFTMPMMMRGRRLAGIMKTRCTWIVVTISLLMTMPVLVLMARITRVA